MRSDASLGVRSSPVYRAAVRLVRLGNLVLGPVVVWEVGVVAGIFPPLPEPAFASAWLVGVATLGPAMALFYKCGLRIERTGGQRARIVPIGNLVFWDIFWPWHRPPTSGIG